VVTLRLKGTSGLRARLLYSRRPGFVTTRLSCPEVGVREPVPVTFYRADLLEGELSGVPAQRPGGQWQMLELGFNAVALQDAPAVDACQRLVQEMEKRFGTRGAPLTWGRGAVTEQALRTLARRVAGSRTIIQVALKLDDGKVIKTNGDDFVPHVRQRIALRQPDGKLTGAQLWLRADRKE